MTDTTAPAKTGERTAASTYVDAALEVLGGEDTEFYLTAQDKSASGAFGRASVVLSCRYQGCEKRTGA